MQCGLTPEASLSVFASISLQERVALEWGNSVKLVYSDMRNFFPREKADIIVSELLGSFGDNELSPECLDGVMRCLKRTYHPADSPARSTDESSFTACSGWDIHTVILRFLPCSDHDVQIASRGHRSESWNNDGGGCQTRRAAICRHVFSVPLPQRARRTNELGTNPGMLEFRASSTRRCGRSSR